MSTDNIAKLNVGNLGYSSAPESYLGKIDEFIEEYALFDIDGNLEDDVELDVARSDEYRLGPLNSFERRAYTIGVIADSVIKDTLVEFEAGHADAIVNLMRTAKIPYHAAVQRYVHETGYAGMPEDQQEYLSQLSCVLSAAMSAYEFGVRSRYLEFRRKLIVRKDFIAHAFIPQG